MRSFVLLPAAFSLVLVGCGDSGNVPQTVEKAQETKLRDVGEVYRVYQIVNKRPPKNVKELQAVSEGSLSGYEAIRSGDVVVQWNATLPNIEETPGGGSPEVLAYLKDAPEKGGPVLMLDRSIKVMTADEFKAAKKAGTP